MSNKAPVPNLPPISGIQDPQVRSYLQALTNAWAVRNGQAGDGMEKFLTVRDLQEGLQMVQQGKGGFLGGSGTSITAPGVIASLIQTLSDQIQQSRIWRLLGERIDKIEIPDWFRNKFGAEIKEEQIKRESATSSLASQITTVTAAMAGSVAGVRKEINTVANTTNALAEEVTQVIAQTNQNIALVDNRVKSVSDLASATASNVSTLQTTVNGVSTRAQQALTLSQNIDGQMDGAWSVKFDANGYVTGAGLGIEGKGGSYSSEFVVRADRFSIGSPVNPAAQWDADIPFIVTTIPTTMNGVTYPPGVWLKNAMIADASITSAKIGNAAIGSAQIANAAIKSAHIEYLSVDTLHLKEGAVTFNVFQETWGPPGLVGQGGKVQLMSFAMPSSDRPRIVEINYSPTVGPYVYKGKNWGVTLRLYRGATLLEERSVDVKALLYGSPSEFYPVEGGVRGLALQGSGVYSGIPGSLPGAQIVVKGYATSTPGYDDGLRHLFFGPGIVPVFGTPTLRKFTFVDYDCPSYAVNYRVEAQIAYGWGSVEMNTEGKQTIHIRYFKR